MADLVNSNDAGGLQTQMLGAFAVLLERHGPMVDIIHSPMWPRPLSLYTGNSQLFPQSPLIMCSNRPVSKAVLALWSISREIHSLSSEIMSLVARIRLYGAGLSDGDAVSVSEAVLCAARFLPMLDRVRLAKSRCRVVLFSCLQQVGRLYATRTVAITNFHVHVVFEQIGKLLSAVCQLDSAIVADLAIKSHWSLYEKWVHTESAKSRDTQLTKLSQMVKTLRREVLRAVFFSYAIKGVEMLKHDPELNFTRLIDELGSNLLHVFQTIESSDCCDGDNVIPVVCLFVLMCRLTCKCDSRMWSSLASLHRRMPTIALKHGLPWQIDQFLTDNICHITQRKMQPCLPLNLSWLNRTHQTLAKDFSDLQTRIFRIASDVCDCVRTSSPTLIAGTSDSARFGHLLTESVQLMRTTSSICCQLLEIHTAVGMAIPADIANQVCWRFELVKSLEHLFFVNAVEVLKLARFDRRPARIALIGVLVEARRSISKRLINDPHDVDVLTALDLAISTLKAPITPSSLILVRVCLSLCTNRYVMSDEKWSSVNQLVSRLQLLSSPLIELYKASDCRFVFWRLGVLVPFMKHTSQRPDFMCRVRMLLSSVATDVTQYISVVNTVEATRIGCAFDRQMTAIVDNHLIQPTMKRVEHLLRIDIHTDLLAERPCPLVSGLEFTRGFMEAGCVSGVICCLDLSETVGNQLERVFYVFSAVSAHDVCKYAEMCHLTRRMYALPLNGCELPLHRLDRGVDLLAIARHLHRFVSRHYYHIFTQIFSSSSVNEDCQAMPTDNAVVVLSPIHTAAWLRIHGPGVADTVVNSVYQLLRHQVVELSHLFSAERLIARVRRAVPLMHAAVNEANSGDKLFRTVEELGSAVVTAMGRGPEGISPLHVLAELLGRIGSALGLIRVIYNGLLRCFSDADQFLSLYGDKVTEKWCHSSSSLSHQSRLSVDNAVSYVNSVCADKDYCVVIVEALSSSLKTPGHAHLQYFHALVPALMLHVAADVYCGASGTCVTRGSIVLGVTFLLALLGQREQYAALQWPQHVDKCLQWQIHEGEILCQKPSQAMDAGLSNTALMAVERLKRHHRRHLHLNSAMSASWLVLHPV